MDVKPKTWRERLPRWMGGKAAEPEIVSLPDGNLLVPLGATPEQVEAAATGQRPPRAIPVRRARYETCMDCNDTVDAWRTYADGTRRCLPCDQAQR